MTLSILLLASVVIGGLGSLSGVIFGALLLEFLPIYAQDPPLLHLRASRSSRRPSSSGSILILIVLLVPGGVAGLSVA